MAGCMRIYIYISAGPNGAHGCEDRLCSPAILAISSSCSVLVSLLSRHPAISVCSSGLRFCFLGSPVLSSLFSMVLLKAVRATETSNHAQEPHSLKLSGSGPDLSDSLSSLETFLKTTEIQLLTRSGWPGLLLKSSPRHINAHPPGVAIFHRSPGNPG